MLSPTWIKRKEHDKKPSLKNVVSELNATVPRLQGLDLASSHRDRASSTPQNLISDESVENASTLDEVTTLTPEAKGPVIRDMRTSMHHHKRAHSEPLLKDLANVAKEAAATVQAQATLLGDISPSSPIDEPLSPSAKWGSEGTLQNADEPVLITGDLEWEGKLDQWKQRKVQVSKRAISYVRKTALPFQNRLVDLILIKDITAVEQDNTCFLLDETCFAVKASDKTFFFKTGNQVTTEKWLSLLQSLIL